MPAPAPWETRIHRTVVVGLWIALAVGVIAHAAETSGGPVFWVTVVLAAAYVMGTTAIAVERYWRPFGSETITPAGAVAGAVVLVLSGAAASPYTLLTVGAPMLRALTGGFRAVRLVGAAASVLVTVTTVAQG